MDFTLILFYLFGAILTASAITAISTRNMVHSVMFLILGFLNAAGLFVLLGAEFVAMLLVIVYVGAIAVLFLFVVMMLNIDKSKIKKRVSKSTPILILIALVLFLEIFLIVKVSLIGDYKTLPRFKINESISNTDAIGQIMYTDFFIAFQLVGAILFVAMIGAIVLTLSEKKRFIRKQKINDQILRNKQNSIEIIKVQSGKGIKI